jgi:sulfide:quinone oxidoreductase
MPRRFSLAAIAADRGFSLRPDAVRSVAPERKELTTVAGETVPYDALVLAVGAEAVAAVPGAVTLAGSEDVALARARLEALAERPGARIAFVAAPATAWTLPVYEMALLAAAWASGRSAAPELWVVTHESRPLELFGEPASAEAAELLERGGVRLWANAEVEAVEDGRLWMAMEGGMPVDLAIALPAVVGRPIPGLPHDELGFTPVDLFGRVPGAPDVYAIGDMTTRPLKQGGLAALQADAAASALAAWAGADVVPQPYRPELRAILLTGSAPLYLHRPSGRSVATAVTVDPLWWPPHKIASQYLGPYLAAHPELEVLLSSPPRAGAR